jgi:hypothetical protein
VPTDTKLILLDTTEGGISYPGIRARLTPMMVVC